MKHCSRCGLDKPTSFFYKDVSRGDGRQAWCKDCTHLHWTASKDRRRDYARTYRRTDYYTRTVARRQHAIAAKGGKCMDCGFNFDGRSECADFDHRDGRRRLPTNANVFDLGKARLVEELALCDLVCSNCHRSRTKLRRRSEVGHA